MPDELEYIGQSTTYDVMNPEDNTHIHDTWEQSDMFYDEDKYTHCVLCKLFL